MKIVDFSIKRPIASSMLWVTILMFGFVAFQRLAIDLLPDISYPTLTVRTEYPGTAPAEIENLISIPIEGSVGIASGVVRVSSISRPGISDVIAEFEWGTNMDFASLDVREQLDRMRQLPDDARKPVLLRYDPSMEPIMRIAVFGGMNLMAMRELVEEEVKQDLESLEGVAAAKVSGGLEEEIQVELDVTKLASVNIPITLVTNRLEQENINLTGGTLKEGDGEYIVRTLNEFQNIEEINDIVIGRPNQKPVRLSDIGRAKRGFKDRTVITRLDGEESVEVAIYKEAGSNTVQVASVVRDQLKGIQEYLGKLPQPLQMEVVTDQSVFIRQSIDEVLTTAYLGGVLAIIILYLFLRNLKSTLIIGLSIPISVIATFFLMYSFDVSLNIMSLGGLALGIGMLVDNSIVVLESIDRFRRDKVPIAEASYKGTSIVGMAVTASTLTTVCVFVPIIFVKGIAGQLFTDQALTVTFSLLASLIVAITLIPMLSSMTISKDPHLTEETSHSEGQRRSLFSRIFSPVISIIVVILRGIRVVIGRISHLFGFIVYPVIVGFDKAFVFVAQSYPPILKFALRNRLLVIGGAFLIFLTALYSAQFLGTELIPEMSQGEFYVGVKLPVGTPLETTDATIEQMIGFARRDPRIRMVYTIAGASTESGSTADEEREHIGQMNIVLYEGSSREEEEDVMDSLRRRFQSIPGIEPPKFRRPSYFSFRTPIEVEVSGYNLSLLKRLSERIAREMQDIGGLTDVKSSMEGGNPEIQVVFNREKVAAMGKTVGGLASIVRNKVLGEIGSQFTRRDRRIDIRVRAQENHRETLDDLGRLIVTPAEEVPVPLGAVADLRLEQGPSEIRRIDQRRVAIVSANLSGGRDLGSVAREINAIINRITIPQDFNISVSGQNEEMGRSFDSMKFAMLLAIFMVYIVMASQFESLFHPFVIMFSIPFSLVGVIFILLLLDKSISVVVMIGVIMLAGIVVNNAIVLIDYINHLRRQGMPKIDAVIEAGSVRLRPIVMTTLTTVLGLLPMALGFGEGAEVRAPMAITVIAGLLVSTLLTLIFVPTLYTVLDRKQ